MDFATAFATIPFGAVVAFSDGTPKPPAHHKKKLSAWEQRNAAGRLIGKKPSGGRGPYDRDTITLETGVFGSGGVVVLRCNRVFDAAGTADFTVADTLPVGTFAIISDSIHVGRQFHGFSASRAAIEAEKRRGFNADSYRIVTVGEGIKLIDAPALEEAA